MPEHVPAKDDDGPSLATLEDRMRRQRERFERDRLKPQPVKFEPGYQFPEYNHLRARNIASGKWRVQ